MITSTKLLLLLGLGGLLLGGWAVPAFANEAWGIYSAHNFYSGTAEGLQGVITPYYANPVAWGGTDKTLTFVFTGITDTSFNASPPYAYQLGLLVRYNTKYLDEWVENPGDSSITDTCAECADGTQQHILQLARISNGWQLNFDGSSAETATGGSLGSDYIYQSYHQTPMAIEMSNGVSQSAVDNNFEYSYGVMDYEQSPVGSGTWVVVPNGWSYVSTNCIERNVGDTNAPSWVVVQRAGSLSDWFYLGTTTYLTSGYSVCGDNVY